MLQAIVFHLLLAEIKQPDGLNFYFRLESLVSDLKDSGMTGLECIYSKYSPSDVSGLEHLARKNGLLVTGGSDYHADGKKGVKNPREIGECGITREDFMKYEKLVRILP